jgi:hypothetical protein
MAIVSLVFLNALVLVGAYAFISWLLGTDALSPIRIDGRGQRQRGRR